MTKRRSFPDEFKATVALEALRGDRTAQEIAAKHKVHPTQVTTWKRQAIDGLTACFLTRSDERKTTRPKSKSCMPKLESWRSKTIFCHKG